MMWCEYVENF